MKIKKTLKFLIFGGKRTNLIAALIFGPYLLFYAFPNFTFENKISHGRFTVYSHGPLPNAINILNNAEKLINKSEVDNKDITFKVYITSSFLEYRIFSTIFIHSFALYNPAFGNIYINKTDLLTNKISRPTDSFTRSIQSTLAHEALHKLTHHNLGLIKFFKQPAWIREGYPDYIAGESTYNYTQAAPLIQNGTIEDNPSAMYLVYAESVHVFMEQGLSFKEIISLNKNWEDVKTLAFKRIIEKSKLPQLLKQ